LDTALPLINGIYHVKMASMNTTVTLDGAGRVVIPKPLRDELGLAPGDTLTLESDGDRVMLRPVRSSSPLRKEDGVWVFRGGRQIPAGDTDRVLDALREERTRGITSSSS
jgi:AbrB family looped-hinge helix DNA binding protein